MNEAVKYDDGKLRYDLVPPDALEELVHVYSSGAYKYGDRNWEEGMDYGRVFGAMMRHAWAWWGGGNRDKESGLHHLAHVAWGCFTLIAYSKRGVGTDDRRDVSNEKAEF